LRVVEGPPGSRAIPVSVCTHSTICAVESARRLQSRENKPAKLHPATLRQDEHPLDLGIFAVVVDERATSDNPIIQPGGQENDVRLPKRVHGEKMIALRRIQRSLPAAGEPGSSI
jgi:hypothetical protein